VNPEQRAEAEHPKVFISHANADKDRFVLDFATRLRSNGVDAWVDQWEMNPGDSLVDKIFEEGLKNCRAMIVVLSQYSIESKWVREELNAAVVRKIENATRLIPVRLDRCEVPECLKHCIWQDIVDPATYDSEFKRILNSIYGQYDRPPMGEPPLHVVEKTPVFDGLARIDGTVLEAICRIAIENEMPFVDGEPLVEKLQAVGITEGEIMETQEVLEGRRLLEVRRTLGPPYVYSMKITPMGFDLFAHSCIPEYSKLCGDVGRCLVRKEYMDNRSMAQALDLPLRVVEHILEAFQHNGLIKYSESMGGGLHMDVYWVSPELRRKLEG
jgi:hypothetical protein